MKQTLSHDTFVFLLHYWQDIGSPLSIKLSKLAQRDRWDDIVEIVGTVNNSHIKDPFRLQRARLAVDIIKKADYLPVDLNPMQAAFKKWIEAEETCYKTNRFFDALNDCDNPCNELTRWQYGTKLVTYYLPKIRKEFRRILGSFPRYDIDFFGGFGPGATLSNTRRESSVLHKLSATPTVTSEARWFYPAIPRRLRSIWGDVDTWSVERAGRLAFVPKNYKTDRPIMVEPLVNASIQRQLGMMLRRRLLNVTGIDLSTAPDLHKRLAKEGSKQGHWATVDLSSASDTIAKGLVRYLCDDDWYRVLDSARTKCIDISDPWDNIPGHWINLYNLQNHMVLEKFSSMGNGFTFELETIIFYSIASVAARESGCSVGGVFGDDIIVGTKAVPVLYYLLESLGFTVNTEKSYYSGSFRESCGGDYCDGIDVKGITLKTEPKSVWDWYRLHNEIWLRQEQWAYDFEQTLRWIRSRVPKKWRLSVPKELGLTSGFFHRRPKGKTIRGIHYYRCLVPTTVYQKGWEESFTPEVQLAAGLLGGIASNSKGRLSGPPLLDVKSCKLAWVPLS